MRAALLGVLAGCSVFSSHPTRELDDAGQGSDEIADADPDDDGIDYVYDNCPLTANMDQADADSDGIGDACEHETRLDFDGDRRADLGVVTPVTGQWIIRPTKSSGAPIVFTVHANGTIAPEDFDGDGDWDAAVFDAGTWYVRGDDGTIAMIAHGATGDIPVPADYDGDGRADLATFRPVDCVWSIRRSFDGSTYTVRFPDPAISGVVPIADYIDGDARAELGIFNDQMPTETFVRLSSVAGSAFPLAWGTRGDIVLVGETNGDGNDDSNVWRPTVDANATGPTFYLLKMGTTSFTGVTFGEVGDIPLLGDWDGDGRANPATHRSGTETFYFKTETAFDVVPLGSVGDIPIRSSTAP